ncbi:ATP-binding cassette domain-containing protein [Teichococcus aestuarii]|uniref:ATP-binding cassette domain-containing protein n=1 Tax=Teichococcus aestuarii TaxID=568898 RepID=UPI003614ED1A
MSAPLKVIPGEGGLVATNLGKRYKKRPVVRGVSLSVRRGEAVGLFGPNGAGKTTTFYMMTGLVRPDQGRSSWTGRTSPPCPCTAAPAWGWATCRRRPRSSAGSAWRTTSAPRWRWWSPSAPGASRCWTSCSPSSG